MSDLLQVVRSGDPRVVVLVGELDASNADELVAELEPEVTAGGTLVLDLTGLAFIDSLGLRTFLRIASALEATGRLVLRSPQSSVARTFTLVGMANVPNVDVESGPGAGTGPGPG